MPHTLFILNPVSGRGAGQNAIPAIHAYAQANRVDYELLVTQAPGHAIELARTHAGQHEQIIAVGGDGTFNEVLNGLMLAKASGSIVVQTGIICVGRGNDAAAGLLIPKGLQAGLENLRLGYPRLVDVGRISNGDGSNSRYFANGIGIGFDAAANIVASRSRLTGFAGYLVAVLKTILLYYKATKVEIDLDGQIIRLNSLMISVMNGKRMGGGFIMAPKASIDDGWLDVCVAGEAGRLRILQLLPHFLKGTQESQPEFQFFKARKIKITALDGALPTQVDGEIYGMDGTQRQVEILAGQLQVITPPS